MGIRFHSHAKERLEERCATESEIISAVRDGESFPAKFGRTGFRRNFSFGGQWRGRDYENKQVIVFAVREGEDWLVITVITKFF